MRQLTQINIPSIDVFLATWHHTDAEWHMIVPMLYNGRAACFATDSMRCVNEAT